MADFLMPVELFCKRGVIIASKKLFFFRPPATRVSDKVMIPQDEYPEINFVGLLIGPR